MRKKTIYVLATVMCMSIFTACGSTNRADAGNEVQQEVQAEDNMQKEQQAGAEGNAETELQTEAVPENTAEAVTGEEKTLNGTVDEIKDFMFIVTDDSGASYELSFDAKPQGLENVSVGDKVKDMYRALIKYKKFTFNKLFTLKKHSKNEVVTAFTGLLEMSRRNKVVTEQDELFGDIEVEKSKFHPKQIED